MKRVHITIAMTIDTEGDVRDVSQVVDAVLDAGQFQDAINQHDNDAARMRVRGCAITTAYPGVRPTRLPKLTKLALNNKGRLIIE